MDITIIRESLEMSKTDFAKALGISMPTLNSYENGSKNVSKVKNKILKLLEEKKPDSVYLIQNNMNKEDINKIHAIATSISLMSNSLIDHLKNFI